MCDEYRIRDINIYKLADFIRTEGQLGEEPALHLLDTIRVMREQQLELTVKHAHEVQELRAIAAAVREERAEEVRVLREALEKIAFKASDSFAAEKPIDIARKALEEK